MLAVTFLLQGTWALAGVTGGIGGVVHDDTGAPVAGASVTATSPSQTEHSTTDAGGHFQFLTLAPDTYTITVEKDGYQTVAQSGLTVFADQTQEITLVAPRALKVIARGRTTAAALVKPGVGGDLYNVTPAQQQAEAALGGGGNLESAYSAISAQPGLYVPTGGMGWNQAVVIHGENPWTTGFEYDGVPVNRAFDQYNTSTESSLGLQELQVYTGGGPVSVSSSGISGFINQVIKTGTYPGYASLQGGIGAEAFYHEAKLEVGGATPDRNFSYYAAFGGYDQAARNIDNQDGTDLMGLGEPFNYFRYNNIYQFIASGDYGYGVDTQCATQTSYLIGAASPASYNPACLMFDAGALDFYLTDREDVVNLHFGLPRHDGQRDDFQVLWSDSAMQSFFGNCATCGGPGVAEDTLVTSGMPYNANPNSNPLAGIFGNAFGFGCAPACTATSCAPMCANYPYYNDATTYDLPFGTVVNPGTGVVGTPFHVYYQPNVAASVNQAGFDAAQPTNKSDLYHNDVGVGKIMWTHPFSSSAYMRIYAYSMFSDWNEDGPMGAWGSSDGPWVPTAEDYDLITHTDGAEIAFADQINDENLLQLTGNFITATTSRWNNTGYVNGAFCSPFWSWVGSGNTVGPEQCSASSPIALTAFSGGRFTCYAKTSGAVTSCTTVCTMTVAVNPSCTIGGVSQVGYLNGSPNSNAYVNGTAGEPAITAGSPAALAGAAYETVWNGNAAASWNTVKPQFFNVNLSEEFRPSDRLVLDLAGRYDNYNYILANTSNTQNLYYAQEIQDYACVNPATDHPLLTPLAPGVSPPPPVALYDVCPTGYVHPDGAGGHPLFTDASPSHYDMNFWSARGSATYQSDPNTVWRVSAGRYTEPPLTASVQYLNSSGNNRNQWANFMLFGFLSPFHPIPGETSAQYDASYEHHFGNSQWSIKLSPFYQYSSNWEQQFFIGAGYVTQIPVGDFRSYGAEFELQAGDFSANGLSGILSFTYTNASVKYQSLVGESAVLQLNTAIQAYDCLTSGYYSKNTATCNKLSPSLAKLGGAQPCYNSETSSGGTCPAAAPPALPAGDSCAAGTAPTNDCWVVNPYYTQGAQGFMDPNGWYPDPSTTGSGLYFGPGYNDAEGFASPYTANLILNYRLGRLAITPSLQLEAGTKYGSPMDVVGVDPTACTTNQGATGKATTNNPYDCNYTTYLGGGISPWGYLYVPNPQTGSFASYGQYTEPNIVVGNVQLSYDFPKVRVTVTAASLWHTCFGGSTEPWATASPAGTYVCGYGANTLNYVGGLNGAGAYVGSSPTDKTANGVSPNAWELQSYLPGQGNGAGGYLPFDLYIQAQIHL